MLNTWRLSRSDITFPYMRLYSHVDLQCGGPGITENLRVAHRVFDSQSTETVTLRSVLSKDGSTQRAACGRALGG